MNLQQIINRYSGKSWQEVALIGIDLETTGLCAWADEVTEVAVIHARTDGQDLEIGASFSSLCAVSDHTQISPRITELTGISNATLVGCDDFTTVWHEKIDPLRMELFTLYVAHNADFEAAFLSAHLLHMWVGFDHWWLDTLILARAADRELNRFAKGYKLIDLANRFGLLPNGDLHRAMPDADLCLRVLQRLILQAGWKTPVDALMAQRWWLDNAR